MKISRFLIRVSNKSKSMTIEIVTVFVSRKNQKFWLEERGDFLDYVGSGDFKLKKLSNTFKISLKPLSVKLSELGTII